MAPSDETILYIDPSFTGTGLFLLNRSTRTLQFNLIAPPRETMRTYENYFWTGKAVEAQLSSYLTIHQPSVVKLEIPPPVGQTSAGLSGLSYLLLSAVLRSSGLERVELIPPNFISTQQRKHFSDYSPRSLIAKAFLSEQKSRGLGVQTVNEELLEHNDVATAYLFYMFEKVAEGVKSFPVLPLKAL